MPKVEETKRAKRELFKEISQLKQELMDLNEIQPVKLLERRRNDFKTEGEYIGKILNRNIQGEFVNQMKRELRSVVMNLTEGSGQGGGGDLDQIKAVAIPGCDELNEKLDEAGIEGISISQRTEKLLLTINKCHMEVCKKVYTGDAEKRRNFEDYCVEMMALYFKKKRATGCALPQFLALLLNDLSFTSVFASIHFRHSRNLFKKMRQDCFEKFATEQKKEIASLLVDFQVRSVKKVSLFLTRLSKVMASVALKSDLVNIQFILVNFAQERAWKQVQELQDIGTDEIDGLVAYCEEVIRLGGDIEEIQPFLLFKTKLSSTVAVLKSSLLEIINSYRLGRFQLSDSELRGLLAAIFASSPLRNEFMRELEIGEVCDGYGGEDNEYF